MNEGRLSILRGLLLLGTGAVYVVGPPGSGKTSLVTEAVERLKAETKENRSCFLCCRALSQLEPAQLASFFMLEFLSILCPKLAKGFLGCEKARDRKAGHYSFQTLSLFASQQILLRDYSSLRTFLVFDNADFLAPHIGRTLADVLRNVQDPSLMFARLNVEIVLVVVSQGPQRELIRLFSLVSRETFRQRIFFHQKVRDRNSCVRTQWLWPSNSEDDRSVFQASMSFCASHHPMSRSYSALDSRRLAADVLDMIPAIEEQQDQDLPSTSVQQTCSSRPAVLVFSKAWHRYKLDKGKSSAQHQLTPLVLSLQERGESVLTLCLAGFYCATIPADRDSEVFGTNATLKPHRKHRRGETAAYEEVSTPRSFPIERLLAVYRSISVIVKNNVAAQQEVTGVVLLPSDEVSHYLNILVTIKVFTLQSSLYRTLSCTIVASDAELIAFLLDIRLVDLLPLH